MIVLGRAASAASVSHCERDPPAASVGRHALNKLQDKALEVFATAASLRQHMHAAIGVAPLAYRRTFQATD
jgi:hypothetical protein